MKTKKRTLVSGAMAFITLMGIVSLFSDMTHEGARSVLGEYLNLAGASAATIGFVSGVGELCGYSLRLLSGFLADKTKKYWTLVIVGYALQVLAIPALALIPENGWVLGALYDFNPMCLVIVSMLAQILAIVFYLACIQRRAKEGFIPYR